MSICNGDRLEDGIVIHDIPLYFTDGNYYILVQLKTGGSDGTSWDGFRPPIMPPGTRELKNLRWINMGKEDPSGDGYDID